eukprot:gene57890-biopygen85988
MAIQKDDSFITEAHLVKEALFEYWVKQVFQQQERTDDIPPAPPGYAEFVSGTHPRAEEIRKPFGFIAEVDVFDVVYPMNALRDWAHLTENPLFILWLDQFKAYDSMNWGGLFAYMEYCDPITINGVELTIEAGGIDTQSRILGGCIHMKDEQCRWRMERAAEQKEDLQRCCGLPLPPSSIAPPVETFHYSRYFFGIETCTETMQDTHDQTTWASIRNTIKRGPRHGGYAEAYQLPPHLGGRGLVKPSDYVAMQSIATLHRTLHGKQMSARILRAYWAWVSIFLGQE